MRRQQPKINKTNSGYNPYAVNRGSRDRVDWSESSSTSATNSGTNPSTNSSTNSAANSGAGHRNEDWGRQDQGYRGGDRNWGDRGDRGDKTEYRDRNDGYYRRYDDRDGRGHGGYRNDGRERKYGRNDRNGGRNDYRERNKPRRNNDPWASRRDNGHGGSDAQGDSLHLGARCRDPISEQDLQRLPAITEMDRTKFTKWDVKRAGFEDMSAERAKFLGIFSSITSTGVLKKNVNVMSIEELRKIEKYKDILDEVSLIDPLDSKNLKIIIVENVKGTAEEDLVLSFFESFLDTLEIFDDNDQEKIVSHSLVDTRLVVQFANFQLAAVIYALQGYMLANGEILSLSRPAELVYPTQNFPETIQKYESTDKLSFFSKNVAQLYTLTNIPIQVDSNELKTILGDSIGDVNLLLDKSGNSKGMAFVEILEDASLNAIKEKSVENRKLRVFPTFNGFANNCKMDLESLVAATMGKNVETRKATRILDISNMYDYIKLLKSETLEKDMERKFSVLEKDLKDQLKDLNISVKIPKPQDLKMDPQRCIGKLGGFGRVFVKFENLEACSNAMKRIAGMKYLDRELVVSYFSEKDFDLGIF